MDKQTCKFILAVLAVSALVYSAAFIHGLLTPEIRLLPDSYEYLAAAKNLRDHGTFYVGSMQDEVDYSLFSRRPPGYPFLLLLISMAHPSASLPVLFQVLLIFTGGILLWKINEKMEVSPRFNVLVLAVYLLYPGQIIYSQMIMAETVLQFLLLASVFFLVLFLDRKTWLFIVLVNVCLGLAVLCKPAMLYFWLPNLFIHLLLFKKLSRKIILASALIPLLFISLWSWRNYQVTGVFHFSSLKTTHMKFSIPGATEKLESSKAGFSEEFKKTEESALDVMMDPAESVSKIIRISRNMVTFFLDPGRFDIYRFIPIEGTEISSKTLFHPEENRREYFSSIPVPILVFLGTVLLLNLVIFLAFIPFIFLSKPDYLLRLYILLVVLYMCAVVAVAAMGTARYRISVEPLLLTGAAVAAASAWKKFRSRYRPRMK